MAVTRWAVDRYTTIHESLADFINIIDGVGEMAKVPALTVVLGVPVVREFDLRLVIAGSRKKNQRETALFAFVSIQFLQAEFVAIKIQRLIQIAYHYHGV